MTEPPAGGAPASEPVPPLSAAATQLLLDLRAGALHATKPATVSRLAVQELVLRGRLRVLSVRERLIRRPIVMVSKGYPDRSSQPPLPAPLHLLDRAIPRSPREELRTLIRAAARSNPGLFRTQLTQATLSDLRRRNYVEYRLPVDWPNGKSGRYPALTAAGLEAAAEAASRLDDAWTLPLLANTDEAAAARAATGLGSLVLLVPSGLEATARLAGSRRRNGSGALVMGGMAVDSGFGFDVLETLGEASSAIVDGLDADVGPAFDSAIGAAFDSLTGAVDSSVGHANGAFGPGGTFDGGGGSDGGGSFDGGGGGDGGGGD